MTVEQRSCTPALRIGCECLCALYGVVGIEEDVVGSLLMAQAFPKPLEGGESDEVDSTESIEGLRSKEFRLSQFLLLLRKDMTAASELVGPKREELKTAASGLYDRCGFMNVLKSRQGDAVLQVFGTCGAWREHLQPEAVEPLLEDPPMAGWFCLNASDVAYPMHA